MMVAACKRYDLTQEKPSMDFADRLRLYFAAASRREAQPRQSMSARAGGIKLLARPDLEASGAGRPGKFQRSSREKKNRKRSDSNVFS